MSRRDRLPRRRRPRRPGAADRARAGADRRRRRDPLRPPDPRRARSTARAPTPSSIYVGKEGRGPQMPQERDRPAAASSTPRAGQARRAAEGRRPVRVRPRRRGGAGAARGRDPVRGRARRDRRASPRPPTPASRSPIASAPARSRSSPATRTPTSPSRRSTGRRSPRSRGRSSSTWACKQLPRIAEQLIAGGRDGRRAGGGDRARHAARPAHGRRDAGDDRRRAPPTRGSGAPSITRRRRRSPRCARRAIALVRAAAARTAHASP